MSKRLERAVTLAADFLREAHEDLRYAAIMASNDDQPRRAQSLSRAANTAKELASELIGAWVDARTSEPKATTLVGATLVGVELEPGATLVYVPPEKAREIGGATLVPRGGETVTIARGSTKRSHADQTLVAGFTSLQMPAATPPEVVDVLFSIARPLGLDGDTVWPIESLAREVRELASDAGYNDEVSRSKVSIDDVCRALGIDAWIHEPVDGDDVARPATREEIIAKLEGIREAMLVSLEAPWRAARTIAGRLEFAEEGLVSKLAERLGEVDPDWLAALVRESS